MKSSMKVLCVTSLISLAVVATAPCQTQVTVDEFGNGTLNGAPLSVIGVHPLEYVLPLAATPGDVVLNEPGSGVASDVIDFDGNGHLWFYSDLDGPDSLADTSLVTILTHLQANTVYVAETGLGGQPYDEELNNGAYWNPTAGQPGYDVSNPQYTFISEVPEPSSVVLLVSSIGFLGLLGRKPRS